ncbi:MAG: hypothetical protein E7045_00825 [Lentisphaerae bacterium]|nr:hypothetical protein [Lentisphaerota bacterium]
MKEEEHMKKMNLSGLAKKHLKFLPNTLTIFNSICGFIAIIYTLRAYETEPGNMRVFCISAIMIFSAMVFDALDGLAARLLDAASEKGIQMDSLSDMVTFGVAPAVLVAIMTHSLRDWAMDRSQELLVYALCSIYIGCAALRLATYNVMAMSKEKKDGNYFSGLPSPGAAAAICVMVFFAAYCKIPVKYFAMILPIYAAVLGLLMVSTIPYIHAGRWLFSMWKNRFKFAFFVMMLVIIAVFRLNGLVFIVTAYILSGPLFALVNKCKGDCKAK